MQYCSLYASSVIHISLILLVKSLYGLKQVPNQWHLKFNEVVAQFGFTVYEYDKCIYSKNFDNEYIILCLYVDILILDTSLDVIERVKNYLS